MPDEPADRRLKDQGEMALVAALILQVRQGHVQTHLVGWGEEQAPPAGSAGAPGR